MLENALGLQTRHPFNRGAEACDNQSSHRQGLPFSFRRLHFSLLQLCPAHAPRHQASPLRLLLRPPFPIFALQWEIKLFQMQEASICA